MRDRSIRAIAAGIVLIGIGVAALAQMGPGDGTSAMAVASDQNPGPDAGVEPPSASESTPVETSPTTEPRPFTYRLAVLSGPTTDNFWAFYGEEASVWNSYVLGPTKPALYRVDPVKSALTPELATAAESPVLEEGTWRVRVELTQTASWSDGFPITAHDLAFTFDTVRALGLGGSWGESFPETVVSVHAESSRLAVIEFAERPTLAVWPHAVGTAPIMPSHVWSERVGASPTGLYAMSGRHDVGGGPLAIADITKDSVTSVANPGYPLDNAPDVVEYVVYEDEEAAVDALVVGEVDAILTPKGLTADHLVELETNPSVAIETSPANGVRYLGFNLRREPMAEPAFRVALALLLDRAHLAETLAPGSQVPAGFVRPANEPWYDPERAAAIAGLYAGEVGERLSRALDGLRQAGYAWETEPHLDEDGTIQPGTGLTIRGSRPAALTILTPGDAYDPARPRYVEEIAGTLALLGFDARPVITDFDTVVDLAFSDTGDGTRQYDMYVLGWTLGDPSLPDHYRPLFASDGTMNNTGYSSPGFDELLASYEGAHTLAAAREHLWAMEETLARDLPYLLLYTTEISEAFRTDRVAFGITGNLGGIQGRLGGIGDVAPS